LARCGPAPCLNGTLSGGIHKKVPRLKFLDNKPAVRPCALTIFLKGRAHDHSD
jgi:hypothetical protein